MGKRRTVQKVEVNSQEPSSSSSKNNRKRTMDNMDNSQQQKKLKKESKTKVHKSSINDLPPEMLMKVLKNVDSESLIGCRLVNRQWNGLASEILQSRDDFQLRFDYSTKNRKFVKYTYLQEERRGNSLSFFIKCFQKPKKFPFAHFSFHYVDSSSFEQSDWIKFISDFGENIKGLKLGVNFNPSISNDGDLIKLTEKVRDLLLIKLPKLEKFGLLLDHRHPTTNSSTVPLFPTTSSSNEEKTFQLPHLKVLYLNELMFSSHTGIVTDLLLAAVNLQKLNPFEKHATFVKTDSFLLLHSLGKLDCLEFAQIEPVEMLSKLKELKETPSAPLGLKLRGLHVPAWTLSKNKTSWSDASVFISHLFESNKDTLKRLVLDSIGFLTDLHLPIFSQVTELRGWSSRNLEPLLPPGINMMETFPVLRCLSLGQPWSKAFPNEECIYEIPTLETLEVVPDGMNKTTIAQISKMCPNLRKFDLCSEEDSNTLNNFPEVGRAIWTHLKKLQSLEIYVDADDTDYAFPAYDSCITGFSIEDCERLYDLLQADALLRKRGSRVKVPKSELKAERKFPSILDLKDLTFFRLRVLCCSWDENLEIKPDLTQKGPTLVSEKCALDLMDNLIYEIEKEVDYYAPD